MFNAYAKYFGFVLVTLGITGCGVEITSGSDSVVIDHETVGYSIQRIDYDGYVQQTLSSGCIDLVSGEEESIYVDDEEVMAEYEFYYRVRDGQLLASVKEDGDSLYRSYHKTDLFADGYMVEQNIVTGRGITYLMTIEDTGCY